MKQRETPREVAARAPLSYGGGGAPPSGGGPPPRPRPAPPPYDAEPGSELADPGEDPLGEVLTEDLAGPARQTERGSAEQPAQGAVLRREGTDSTAPTRTRRLARRRPAPPAQPLPRPAPPLPKDPTALRRTTRLRTAESAGSVSRSEMIAAAVDPAAHSPVLSAPLALLSRAARRTAVFSPARCLIRPSLAAARSQTSELSSSAFNTRAVTTTGFIPPAPPLATTRIVSSSSPEPTGTVSTARPALPSTRETCFTAWSNGKGISRSISWTFFLISLATTRTKPPLPPPTAPRAASSSAKIWSSL